MRGIVAPGSLLLGAVMLLLTAFPARSTTMYATDVCETIVRSEKRLGRNILQILTSGETLQVKSTDNEWATVSLTDGRTGYVQKQYLLERESYQRLAERLQKDTSQQQERLTTLTQELATLRENYKQLQKTAATQEDQLQKVTQQYTQLREGASNFLQLQEQYTTLQHTHQNTQQQLTTINDAYTELRKSHDLQWFIGGAATILFGILLGLTASSWRRGRRRQGGSSYQLPI